MVTKKQKKVVTTAATFGVAMASMYAAHEMSAEIVDITWNGGNANANAPFVSYGGFSQDIDQIPNAISAGSDGPIEVPQFFQWNDSSDDVDGIARTMMLFYPFVMGGPMSMEIAMPGDVVNPATFTGRTSNGVPTDLGRDGDTTFNGTGSAFVVVRPREDPGNLYYFKVSFTSEGPLVYSDGQYGTDGEALTIPDVVVCDNPLGDANGDGNVDLLDVAPFVDAILNGGFICEADLNQDGVVDLLDVAPFVDLLLNGG